MTQLLASVANVGEAHVVLESGADIIDLKNPAEGALGALPGAVLREVVRFVAGCRPVSATIGDLPMQPATVAAAVAETAASGVDIVKIGFFGQSGHQACLDAIAPLAADGVKMVAVLFADDQPPLHLLEALAAAGMHGVMLDTCRKDGKRLGDWMDAHELRIFTRRARALRLVSGLAGSLRHADLPALAGLGADYLGMRGGLCQAASRQHGLLPERVREAVQLLRSCNSSGMAAARMA